MTGAGEEDTGVLFLTFCPQFISVSVSLDLGFFFPVFSVGFCVSVSSSHCFCLCHSVNLLLFASLSLLFLARCHRLCFSVSSPSPARSLGPLLHLPALYLPGEELRTLLTLARCPRGSSARDVWLAPASAALARHGAVVAVGSRPFRGRGSRWGGSGRGIRSGEHWLHKGRERPGPDGPSSTRAGGIV